MPLRHGEKAKQIYLFDATLEEILENQGDPSRKKSYRYLFPKEGAAAKGDAAAPLLSS